MQSETVNKAKPVGLGMLILLALNGAAGAIGGLRGPGPQPAPYGAPAYGVTAPQDGLEVRRLRVEIEAYKSEVERMGKGLTARLDQIDETQASETRRLRERIATLEARRND